MWSPRWRWRHRFWEVPEGKYTEHQLVLFRWKFLKIYLNFKIICMCIFPADANSQLWVRSNGLETWTFFAFVALFSIFCVIAPPIFFWGTSFALNPPQVEVIHSLIWRIWGPWWRFRDGDIILLQPFRHNLRMFVGTSGSSWHSSSSYT